MNTRGTFLDLTQIKFSIILAKNCYRTTNPCYSTVWQDLLPDDRISIQAYVYFYQHPSVHDRRVVMAGAAECVVIFIHGILVWFASLFFFLFEIKTFHIQSHLIFSWKRRSLRTKVLFSWLLCHPLCHAKCVSVFPYNALHSLLIKWHRMLMLSRC